jgi:RNA polymerase sigma-70 factor (ECF subfamily)
VTSHHTRWTLIQRAAAESPADREAFAHLRARWRSPALAGEIDDAMQQVFVDCFKPDGALGRADPAQAGGFRAFLYGVVRNVARGIERARATGPRQPSDSAPIDALPADDESLAQVFDRAWASAVLRDAAALQLERARQIASRF